MTSPLIPSGPWLAVPFALLHLLGAWAFGRRCWPALGHGGSVILGLLAAHHLILALGLSGHLIPSWLFALWLAWVSHGLFTLGHLPKFRLFSNIKKIQVLALAIPAVLTFVAGLSGAMSPAVAYDDLNYHLAIPAQWLKAGAITTVPDLSHSFFPMLLEMNGLWLMGLFGDEAPRVMNAFLALGLGFQLIKQSKTPLAGWIAGAWWIVTPLVVLEMPMLAVEILLAWCVWLVFKGMRHLGQGERERGLALLCLGIGAGVTQKYTMLALVPFLLIGVLKNRRKPLTSIGFFLAAALPVYLRNIVWTGNPFFPFFGNRFPSQSWWDPQLVKHYEQQLFHYGGLGHSLFDFLLLPVRLLIHREAFHGFFSLTLALLPLLLFGWRRLSQPARMAVLLFLYGALVWFKGSQDVRHLLPYAPLLLFGLAECLTVVFETKPMLAVGAAAGITVAHTLQAWMGNDTPAPRLDFLMGRVTRHEFLTRHAPLYQPYQQACRLAGKGKILLADNLTLTYYLPCRYSRGHLFFQGYWNWWRIRSSKDFLKLARHRNITFILRRPVRTRESFIPPKYPALMKHVTEENSQLVMELEGLQLWHLKQTAK